MKTELIGIKYIITFFLTFIAPTLFFCIALLRMKEQNYLSLSQLSEFFFALIIRYLVFIIPVIEFIGYLIFFRQEKSNDPAVLIFILLQILIGSSATRYFHKDFSPIDRYYYFCISAANVIGGASILIFQMIRQLIHFPPTEA